MGRAKIDLVFDVLKRATAQGGLDHIPRKALNRDIVLATTCLPIQRRCTYTEADVNQLLRAQLDALQARVDHVTCRRYLVDYGFVKRDRAGLRYFINYPKIEQVLDDDAIAHAPRLIAEAIAAQRKPPTHPLPAD